MSKAPERNRENSVKPHRKSNPKKEISDRKLVCKSLDPLMTLAPNEPIWETEPKSATRANAFAKCVNQVRGANLPDLEEDAHDAKKPLGVPPKPIHELLSRASPEPESLNQWADRIEIEQKQLTD